MLRRTKSSAFPWLGENEYYPFPDPREARAEGIVGVGGNLSPGMLLSAYRQGIFPWFSERDPLLWWSPDPRFMLTPDEAHTSRRMARILKRDAFRITLDTAFDQVIAACSSVPRPGQDGTWITAEMINGYERLHQLGYAHSCEVWVDDQLVGGLYGVSIGKAFFGESMFAHESNASKAAFLMLASILQKNRFHLIDAQVYTPHLASLGAKRVRREDFLAMLATAVSEPTIRGNWGVFAEDFSD